MKAAIATVGSSWRAAIKCAWLALAVCTLIPTSGTLFAAPSKSLTSEYFAVTKLPSPPGSSAPTLFWRDAKGAMAQFDGVFYRLENNADKWVEVRSERLPVSAGALTVSADGKLFVVDGKTVFSLEYAGNLVVRIALPDLPVAVASGDVKWVDGTLYVAGRDAEGRNIFLRGGEALEPWSTNPSRRVLLAHSQGMVYVFSEDDDSGKLAAYAYTPRKRSWQTLGTSEFPMHPDAAFACGDAHILFLTKGAEKLGGLYLVPKRWLQFPADFLPLTDFFVDAKAESFTVVSSKGVFNATAVFPATKYGLYDHLVVAAFFVLMLWMGRHFSKREKTQDDFFRGGRRFPPWAVGLSMFATGASAISLMAMPAKAYAENWIYFSIGILQFLLLPVAFYIVIPLARRLQFSSAYEYLEARYCRAMRLVGSISYISSQVLGRLATIMLLPSVALTAICGIPMEWSILIMGVVTTLYCMMGGFEAVIWTDVIQAIVMLLAVGLCVLWVFLRLDVPTGDMWNLVRVENKLQMADFSWNVTQPIFFIILLTSVLNAILPVGDQNFIQRVQALPSEKQARRAVVTQIAVALPMNALLFALGTCLFVYYHFHAADIPLAMKADAIFPLFAAQNLPVGLAGLVVAALMAATMSTLSSALNSVSNVMVIDFVSPWKKGLTERETVVWGKGLTIALGMLGTALALWLARSNTTSIWDLILLIMGVLFSPLGTMFLLGVLTTRVHTGGILAGFVAGYAATLYCNYNLTLHPFFLAVIGLFPSMIVAYAFCLIFPRKKPRDLTGLTVFSLPPNLDEDTK